MIKRAHLLVAIALIVTLGLLACGDDTPSGVTLAAAVVDPPATAAAQPVPVAAGSLSNAPDLALGVGKLHGRQPRSAVAALSDYRDDAGYPRLRTIRRLINADSGGCVSILIVGPSAVFSFPATSCARYRGV